MKKIWLLFILITSSSQMNAQMNLVPNFSFEDTANCAILYAQPAAALPWFNPTISSPDYYYGVGGTCGFSAFNNINGFQLPRTGNAYTGLITYLPNSITRDYVEVKLIDSLKPGYDYLATFYVSRAENFKCVADGMGIYFSVDSIIGGTFGNLPYSPQVSNPSGNILYDTLNWIPISGIYTALGGEKFITIGNFNNNGNTVIDTVPGTFSNNHAYYYIDDVSLICVDSLCSSNGLNAIKSDFFHVGVSPNPFAAEQLPAIIISGGDSKIGKIELSLFDCLGQSLWNDVMEIKSNFFRFIIPVSIGIHANGVMFLSLKRNEEQIKILKLIKN